MNKAKVCVILPALNESQTIGKVIDEIPQQDLKQEGYTIEVPVVDNGSTDPMAQIAWQKGAMVISELWRSNGRAVRSAFGQVNADFVFMIDSDYTYPTTYIPDMLKASPSRLFRDDRLQIEEDIREKVADFTTKGLNASYFQHMCNRTTDSGTRGKK